MGVVIQPTQQEGQHRQRVVVMFAVSERIIRPAAALSALYQTRILKDGKMPGHRGLAQIQDLDQLADTQLPAFKQFQYPCPGRVTSRFEN